MQIVWGSVEGVALDRNEVCRRLQVPRDFPLGGMDECLGRLTDAMDCRFAYVRIPVEFPSDGVCRFDFCELESRDLYRNLCGCGEVFLLSVTLGIGVDRLLCRLKLLSPAEHFITDALASAAAEALCDSVNVRMAEGLSVRPRFSPGYGDVPLSVQVPFLRRLQSESTVGITLNEACLMTPVKSVTAFVGIN